MINQRALPVGGVICYRLSRAVGVCDVGGAAACLQCIIAVPYFFVISGSVSTSKSPVSAYKYRVFLN